MNKIRYVFVVVCLLLSVLVGCNKEDSSEFPFDNPSGAFTSVAVFNAISNSTGVELAVQRGDMKRPMVTASDKLMFGQYLAYKNWYSGGFELEVRNRTGVGNEDFVKHKIDLSAGAVYSLFLYKNVGIKNLLSFDNVILPGQGKAKVRVAHLCENLGNVHVYINEEKGPLFKESKYETVSEFVTVDIKNLEGFTIQTLDGKVTFDLPLVDAKVNKQGIYTILLKGTYKQDGNKEEEEYVSLINQLK